jgi:uncharacterized membrane protein
MEEPMLTATQHERIDRYLAELTGALGDLPEAERDDVVAGIREHVQAALAARPAVTDADVDEVLRALGDPLAIAAEATGDDSGGPAVVTPGDGRRRDVPLTARDWIPAAVFALLGAAPLVLGFFVGLLGGFFLLPFALVAGWVLWVSPLWTVGEKVAATFLLPVPGLVFFTLLFGGTEVCSSIGSGDGTLIESCTTEGALLAPIGAWVVIGVLAVAAVVTAVVLLRNGRRRAAAVAQSFSTGA